MRILLVEDDESARKGVLVFLCAQGHQVTGVSGGGEALLSLRSQSYDLVLTDVRMPGMDGLTLLARLRQENSETPVLLMTAFATVEEAVQALHAGADDYLTKPLNLRELAARIQRVEDRLSLLRENRQLKDRLRRVESPHMVGVGKAIEELRRSIARLAGDPGVPVMIYGESGTGKELVARTIHGQSLRSAQPFMDVSCAALSDELLDSELFGHKKGAFTGAYRDKEGILQAAHRGTLFLDEVSEMSARMQSKLLRFLQEHTILPVGSTAGAAVDVRVIGASNQDLQELVRAGKFRADLYYRMNVVEVHVPPLRHRLEDIPSLVAHFSCKHSGAQRRPLRLSREAYDCLERHSWPGNVRELENLVRVLLVSCDKEEAGPLDLPGRVRPESCAGSLPGPENWERATYQTALHAALAGFEASFLRYHLGRHAGNISRTAAAIGLSRAALHKKINQYGIVL
ncbi:MAG: sigma-54-dependent Fis family transcriptional regulator [Acidobacteria bacterium]|nr:sigma-54-dependent Fis family transcriptional regulator [Acidobacteriota bacterium]